MTRADGRAEPGAASAGAEGASAGRAEPEGAPAAAAPAGRTEGEGAPDAAASALRAEPAAGASVEPAPPGDTVAAVVRQWQAVRPDLDTGPMEIIGRVNRCAALLQQAEDAPLRRA
ncbi:MarR family transcriptional regulator, partial [Streptomyces sp. NPDC058272]